MWEDGAFVSGKYWCPRVDWWGIGTSKPSGGTESMSTNQSLKHPTFSGDLMPLSVTN
jgi:hypothetical protein